MRYLIFFGLLCAALLGLGGSVAQAVVAPSHGLLFELRQLPPPATAKNFEGLCGLAVDQDGKLYVADYYNDRVVVLNSSASNFEGELGKIDSLDGPCGLAVDPTGDLFVNNYHRDVAEFTFPWGTGSAVDAGNSPDTSPALRPVGLARDPGSGRIYVDDHTYIAAYEPSGAPVEVGGKPLQIGLDPAADYYGLAVSGYAATAGYLYVADAATRTIDVFDPAAPTTAPVAVIDGEGAPGDGFNDLVDAALAVDPVDGHIFVVDNTQGQLFEHPQAGLFEFNSDGDFRGQILPHELLDGQPSGLALAPAGAQTTGDIYVTSGNSQGSKIFGLGPTGPASTLKVSLAGEGEGVVGSQPAGIRCGGACVAEFNEGASVTLTATPDSGSAFAGWSVVGSASCPGTGTCTVALASGVEVTADFEQAPAPLAILGPGGGGPSASQAAPAEGGGYSSMAAPAGTQVATPSGAHSSAHQRRRHHRRRQHHRPSRGRR